MKIYKDKAKKAFKNYAENYDVSNVSIALKISHTFRVAEISERIARTIPNVNPEFSWLLGLLHDIGRFEQITRFNTFKDVLSVDHAELGADILFQENLIREFLDLDTDTNLLKIAEAAIRAHNKLKIPDDFSEETKIYANILRDADKTDIFRVLTEPPFDKRELENLTVRDEILQCIHEHRCVPRAAVEANALEILAAQCGMAFEIVYPETKKIVSEQGFLKKLIEQIPIIEIRKELLLVIS